MLLSGCLLLLQGAVSISASTPSGPAPLRLPRVLVIGDSWATYEGPALREAFQDAGDGEHDVINMSVPGAKASVFDQPFWLQFVIDELHKHPSIDTVHLAIGSVDFLTEWHADDSPAQQAQLFDGVVTHIESICQTLHAAVPGLEVFIAGYDYMNFVETVGDTSTACYDTWKNVFHQPTAEQVNLGLRQFELRYEVLDAVYPFVHYVGTFGFLQSYWGYPSKNLPPFSWRLPDLTLPSPPEAMGSGGHDCVHPNAAGYELLARHYYNSYYRARFHPDALLSVDGPSPGKVGLTNKCRVSGLAPFEPALLVFGQTPGYDASIGCPEAFLGIAQLLGSSVLLPGGNGTATAAIYFPSDLAGKIVLVQALQPSQCKASSVSTLFL